MRNSSFSTEEVRQAVQHDRYKWEAAAFQRGLVVGFVIGMALVAAIVIWAQGGI